MHHKAFIIAGDRAAVIANDVRDVRCRAGVHHIPVGVQSSTRVDGAAETQFMLEDGTLEFMVGGASTFIAAPGVVRVPPGVAYAYRNIGDETARLLMRSVEPQPNYRMIRASIEYAA
jgi:mannose-6-phosphate isomerase-like protein (cupin superfamily)